MNTQSIVRTSGKWRERNPLYKTNEESSSQLDFSYFWTLAIGGILFLAAIGHLNWCSGIGWFFLSRFISIFLVRWDMSKNNSNIYKCCKIEDDGYLKWWLN